MLWVFRHCGKGDWKEKKEKRMQTMVVEWEVGVWEKCSDWYLWSGETRFAEDAVMIHQ